MKHYIAQRQWRIAKAALLKKGWSFADLARSIGLARGSVYNTISGLRRNPATLEKIEKVLDLETQLWPRFGQEESRKLKAAKQQPIHRPPPPRSEPHPTSTAKKQPPVHTPPGSQMREADKIPEGNKLIQGNPRRGKI